VKPFETMRIAVRDSDSTFRMAWVEDSRLSPRFISRDDLPYVVVQGYGQGDGGYQSVIQSCKTLEEAVSIADMVVDSLLEHGDESDNPAFHGFRDATFEGVESLGMDRSLGWVFSAIDIEEWRRLESLTGRPIADGCHRL